MRPDMAKVIVERPRLGSRMPTKGKGYGRRTARLAWEDQPQREGMKVRGGRSKWLNEHLAPLRRYLAGQVGRPWNKIFADVCRYLDRNSAVQDHLRDHLNDYVAVRVIVVGGELCHGDGWRIGHPLRTLFYVCPRTGLLKKTPDRDFTRCEKLPIWFLDNDMALVRKDSAWHIVTVQKLLDYVWVHGAGRVPGPRRWDVLLQIPLDHDKALRIYGRPVHVVAVRRARKREVRRIVNSYPYTNVVR